MRPRMRRQGLAAVLTSLVLTFASAAAAPAAPVAPAAPGSSTAPRFEITAVGGDVSWPQCPKGVGIAGRRGFGLPLPPATAGFMVVGLTNGIGFTVNPCLGGQVAYATAAGIPLAVYALATYPTRWQLSHYGWHGPFPTRTLAGRLSNSGYAEAAHTLATMRRAAVTSPIVWIDIEGSRTRPWSRTKSRNVAVVAGLVRAYTDAGYRVGFYSTTYQWNQILGRAPFRGYPEWRTVGARGQAAALRQCTAGSFQGGPAVLAQWWSRSRDYDVLCAQYRSADRTGEWFALQGNVPAPTPTPGDTATPTPGDTATPTPGDTATPTPGDTATPTPGGTAAPDPGVTAPPLPGGDPTPQVPPVPAGTALP